MPPGRGSVAEQKFLALPYYSQHAVFASPLSTFLLTVDFFYNLINNYKHIQVNNIW